MSLPAWSFVGAIVCLLLGGAGIDNQRIATAVCFFIASFTLLVAACIGWGEADIREFRKGRSHDR